MARPALRAAEIAEFRDRLCDAALRLFAERGYEGFTLRALGDALGCSPTTPYRYFRDKSDIYEAVCARAFEDLCAEQEAERASATDPWDGIRAQGRSYVAFARANPHAYRVMFDLRSGMEPCGVGDAQRYAEPVRRSWKLLSSAFVAAAEVGELDGEPKRIALAFWASTHGIMSLELSGRLFDGVTADSLVVDLFDRFERAYRPRRRRRR